MNPLDLIPGGRWAELAVIGSVIALATGAYGLQAHRITTLKAQVATEKQGRDQDRAAYATAAASAAAENLAKTARILNTQSEAANAAQIQTQRADVAERAAARSADGLRIAAHTLASGCRAVPGDPAAVASGPATAESAALLADVLGRSVDTARQLASDLDASRISGQFCERAYDSLGPEVIRLPKLRLGE